MKVIHIGKNQENKIAEVNKCISSGYYVFVLVYLEGCGPCNATRPEWAKLESTLSSQYINKNVAIVDVDSDLYKGILGIGTVEGFPSIKHIKYKKVESFDDSGIKCFDRKVDCFVKWIESKILHVSSTHKHNYSRHRIHNIKRRNTRNTRHTRHNKTMTGGRKRRRRR